MQNLSGRTFAITGASGNLGPTVRDVLVASGANVVLLDRSAHPQPSDDAERVLGLGGLDLTNPDVIGATLDQAKERFGTLTGSSHWRERSGPAARRPKMAGQSGTCC